MKSPSRMNALAGLWMRHGCPEKMTIHIKSTGETIVLVNGMPFEAVAKVTETPCILCGRPLPEGRAKFCSAGCSRKHHYVLEAKRKAAAAQKAVNALSDFHTMKTINGSQAMHSGTFQR